MAARRDVSVHIDGLRELRARLRNVENGIKDLKDVNRRAAGTVYAFAAPRTPIRTGALAATGRFSGTATTGLVRFGYASVPYAAPIHWGWLTRPNHARGIVGGPILPNPWVSRAAQAAEPVWYEQYVREIERLWDL